MATKKTAASTATKSKPTAKKVTAKKPASRKTTTAKKPAVKKTTTSKTTAKKPATKKAITSGKSTAKKPVAKKPAARKSSRKPTTKKTSVKANNIPVVGKSTKQNLEETANAIDEQMKYIANMDTRILLAMDTLSDFQEKLHQRSVEFQEKNTKAAKRAWENAKQSLEKHHGIVDEFKAKRKQAMDALKEHKTLHETYEHIVEQLEKGKTKAVEEIRKAEANFMKQLHKVEEQMLKKAEQLKKKYKDK